MIAVWLFYMFFSVILAKFTISAYANLSYFVLENTEIG